MIVFESKKFIKWLQKRLINLNSQQYKDIFYSSARSRYLASIQRRSQHFTQKACFCTEEIRNMEDTIPWVQDLAAFTWSQNSRIVRITIPVRIKAGRVIFDNRHHNKFICYFKLQPKS